MQKNLKAYIRQAAKERSRWRRRYIKKAAAQKHRTYRGIMLLLLIGTAIYLTAVGRLRELLFYVSQEKTVEYRSLGDDGDGERQKGDSDLYRLIFRLKTGEIELYHEQKDGKEEWH